MTATQKTKPETRAKIELFALDITGGVIMVVINI